jgi:small subunit ribosomal protein S1
MNNILIKDYLSSCNFQLLKEGSIIKGTIIEIIDNKVIVDIDGKSDSSINLKEFSKMKDIKIGKKLDFFVEKIENKDGMPILSFEKSEEKKNWERIILRYKKGDIISGKIKKKINGGFIIFTGINSFVPFFQIDVNPLKNLDSYLNKSFDFKILKIDLKKKNIILSRRELIEEKRKKERKILLQKAKIGEIKFGIVKNITDYGAFVDLNGVDGLLHITDMSWGRISNPNLFLEVGKKIKVIILGIDYDRERLSLGIKQMKKNPWEDINKKYKIGDKIKGKVVNILPYGIFVEVEEGIEGLIHLSEISWDKRIDHPKNFIKIGQRIDAIILEIQEKEKKVSLGIKQLKEDPWKTIQNKYFVGRKIKGKIRNITSYGAFVELEFGIDGMIHISDMNWTRKINHPKEFLKKNQEVDVVVLNIDRDNKKIALGIKQMKKDPWKKIDDLFRIGDVIKGIVSKITSYGAFISLKNNIDGLVHIGQISENRIDKIEKFLKVGEEVTTRVIKIDKNKKKIGLSIKAANYDKENFKIEIKEYEKLKIEEKDFEEKFSSFQQNS